MPDDKSKLPHPMLRVTLAYRFAASAPSSPIRRRVEPPRRDAVRSREPQQLALPFGEDEAAKTVE